MGTLGKEIYSLDFFLYLSSLQLVCDIMASLLVISDVTVSVSSDFKPTTRLLPFVPSRFIMADYSWLIRASVAIPSSH